MTAILENITAQVIQKFLSWLADSHDLTGKQKSSQPSSKNFTFLTEIGMLQIWHYSCPSLASIPQFTWLATGKLEDNSQCTTVCYSTEKKTSCTSLITVSNLIIDIHEGHQGLQKCHLHTSACVWWTAHHSLRAMGKQNVLFNLPKDCFKMLKICIWLSWLIAFPTHKVHFVTCNTRSSWEEAQEP